MKLVSLVNTIAIGKKKSKEIGSEEDYETIQRVNWLIHAAVLTEKGPSRSRVCDCEDNKEVIFSIRSLEGVIYVS